MKVELHPYRVFLIEMLFLEKFIIRLSMVNKKPIQISRRQEFVTFVQKYAPSNHWEFFYDHYMEKTRGDSKPQFNELVHYMFGQGLSSYRIQKVARTSPNRVVKLGKEIPELISYQHDDRVEKLIKLFQPIKEILSENVFYGRL